MGAELAVQMHPQQGILQAKHGEELLGRSCCKIYARLKDGSVRFHKDGYTDINGRFDYISVSGQDGDDVKEYAILVMHDQHGAVVRSIQAPAY